MPTFEPEDPKAPAAKIPAGALPPGRVTKLEGVGLTIAPAFPYKIEDRKTHWTVTDESERARDFYLMRKMFSAKSPLGEVLPCADKSAGAAHAEPDGSYTYSCWGRSSGNGKWFARLVPTNDKQFETVQCMGSAKKESSFKLIETTCRSIKKQ